jgi:hypothetical protein
MGEGDHAGAWGAFRDPAVVHGLWRVSLDAVDAWTAGAATAGEDDKGPFARLLSA